jgi:ATP-binding cassette subfamily A (ABC1) protein 3
MAVVVIIFSAMSKVWFHIGYLFVVLMFYSLASTLLSYLVSLFAKGQLAAFAFSAGGQAIGFLLYLIAFLCVITYSTITQIDNNLLIVHYTMSLIFPMGSLVHALFVSTNLFSAACDGNELSSTPGGMNQFGAPILYLALQSVALFGFLLWHDSDSLMARFKASRQTLPGEGNTNLDEETIGELEKVSQNSAGLRVLHLTKAFGKNTAVENLTFGIQPGEVFALLGPNGAGKSTTISLIRGDIQPSKNGGNIYVDDILISKHRAQARAHLGVCPQFDGTSNPHSPSPVPKIN